MPGLVWTVSRSCWNYNSQRIVRHKGCELPAFQKKTKLPDGQVESEVSVKSTVLLFTGAQLLKDKCPEPARPQLLLHSSTVH